MPIILLLTDQKLLFICAPMSFKSFQRSVRCYDDQLCVYSALALQSIIAEAGSMSLQIVLLPLHKSTAKWQSSAIDRSLFTDDTIQRHAQCHPAGYDKQQGKAAFQDRMVVALFFSHWRVLLAAGQVWNICLQTSPLRACQTSLALRTHIWNAQAARLALLQNFCPWFLVAIIAIKQKEKH